MRHGGRSLWLLVGILALTAVLAGLSWRGSSPTEMRSAVVDLAKLPGTIDEVSYSPNAVIVEPSSFGKGIRSISTNGSVLVFDSTVEPFGRLQPGNVLLVKRCFVRKVLAIEQEGSQIAAVTERAGLADLIHDGHLKWSYPIDFQALMESAEAFGPETWSASVPASTASLQLNPAFLLLIGPRGSGNTLSGSIGGWKYSVHAAPAGDRLNLDLDLKKNELNVASFEIKGSGYLQNFHSTTDIVIKNSNVESFEDIKNGLRGRIDFSWVAGTEATGPLTGEEDIKLPAFFTIPIDYGGIPFNLEIGSAVLVRPGFTGKGEIAKGDFSLEYSGDEGLILKGEQGQKTSSSGPNAPGDTNPCPSLPVPTVPGAINPPTAGESLPEGTTPPEGSVNPKDLNGMGLQLNPTCTQPQTSGPESLHASSQGKVEGKPSIVNFQALSAVGPLGLTVGVAIPRIELKTGTDVLADRVKEAVKDLTAFGPSGLAEHLAAKGKNDFIEETVHKIEGNLVKDTLKTNAAAYVQLILSTSVFASGPNTLVPCQWSKLVVSGRAGVDLTFFGQSIDTGPPPEHEFLKLGHRVNEGQSKACADTEVEMGGSGAQGSKK